MKWLDTLGGKARAALATALVAAVVALVTALGAPPHVGEALHVVLRALLGLFGSNS